MSTLLPGTQVEARGLSWEIVHAEPAGEQQRFRLRCLQGDLRGIEFDILYVIEQLVEQGLLDDYAAAARGPGDWRVSISSRLHSIASMVGDHFWPGRIPPYRILGCSHLDARRQ